MITAAELGLREAAYAADSSGDGDSGGGGNYLLCLRERVGAETTLLTCIDSTTQGNVGRWRARSPPSASDA